MLFLPIGCLIFILFILALPILFILGYFHVITIGFEKLGISPEVTLFLLLAILIGSTINIPLGRKKVFIKEERIFFGLLKVRQPVSQGTAINLGGAVIPVLLSFYFLFLSWQIGVDLGNIFLAILIMAFLTKILAKIVPGKGISLPAFVPPIFSAVLALILAPQAPAICAFICGVLGVLIGADLLNLRRVRRYGGFISIGGAGVFDGIFLVGIVSALLAGF